MDPSLTLAMASFSLGMSLSPGPANMVIVASGANHGFWRTLPFVSGATLGFVVLLLVVGLSLANAIDSHPRLFHALGIAGAAFIGWVGWKITRARPELAVEKLAAPGFVQGWVLQWLNPKAWIACAAGTALFCDPHDPVPLALFVAIYFVVCYLSLASWAVLGARVSVLLDRPWRIRAFNLAMGGLLVATAAWMLGLQLLSVPAALG